MKILAIDGCNNKLAITLMVEDKIYQEDIMPNNMQSETMVTSIGMIMKEANISYHQLDYFLVNRGPGSFTSVRIGLTLAKMAKISLPIKVFSCNYLEVLVHNCLKKFDYNMPHNQFSSQILQNEDIELLSIIKASHRDFDSEFFCQKFIINFIKKDIERNKQFSFDNFLINKEEPIIINNSDFSNILTAKNNNISPIICTDSIIDFTSYISNNLNANYLKNTLIISNEGSKQNSASLMISFLLDHLQNNKENSLQHLTTLEPLYIRPFHLS